jgi:uncharacterized protein (TIGR02677 family)
LVTATPRGVIDEMPEANYLIGHQDGPYYRLIVRFFFERYRAHAHYVRSDEVLARLRETFPGYDEAACRRHLDQLEGWRLVRALPEQSRPATLLELRHRPRTYQAERLAIQLEELRVRLEADAAAATINPTAIEQLVRRLEELAQWLEGGAAGGGEDGRARTYELWRAAYAAFDGFARGVEDYLGDLPRHRPKEVLDYLGFLGYRDVITRYLADYARRLFDRREYVRHLLLAIRPGADGLVEAVAGVAAQQVRADGSSPDPAAERQAVRRELDAFVRYFADGGDVDILLERAQGWVAEITRHARRLSEQQVGGTVRAALLLDLARRFCACRGTAEAEHLAQVAFGLTLPLHWKGEAAEAPEGNPWLGPAPVVPLQPVRRGARLRTAGQATADRSLEELDRLRERQAERERAALALARLFDEEGRLEMDGLRLDDPTDRQRLLRLVYRALAQNGRAGVGYRDWTLTVEAPHPEALGVVAAPDGRLVLPRYRLRLHRGAVGDG